VTDRQKSRAPKPPKAKEQLASNIVEGQSSDQTMASKWPGAIGRGKSLVAGLYVTATPIGNLEDITLRALRVLEQSDVIACEDTRVTAKLLSAYGLKTPLIAYHDHNGPRARPQILARLAAGERVALVSDAGTPLISDPGFKLIAEAHEAGHGVFAVPGASSVSSALSIAGLATDRFLFAGFLAPKSGARKKALEELKSVKGSLVLLEGPSRLAALLKDAADVLGPRQAAIAREITKLHEEVRRGSLEDLAAHYAEASAPKGEIVVVIGPPDNDPYTELDVDAALTQALKTSSVKDAAAEVAEMSGRPRRELYARALEISKGSD